MTPAPYVPLLTTPSASGLDHGDAGGSRSPFKSVGVIVVIVLGILCAILGAIYAYIYFTRINPRTHRARKYIEQQSMEDGDRAGMHTHMFLFNKKS